MSSGSIPAFTADSRSSARDDVCLLLDAIDIPVIGSVARERVDVLAVRTGCMRHATRFGADRARAKRCRAKG